MEKKAISMQIINPNCAGIDVGSRSHFVALGQANKDVREFGVYAEDLKALSKWLHSKDITSVAMESTGTYWQNLFVELMNSGLEVILTNGKFTKNINRKKTDVLDSQWIQKMHTLGLLPASFLPDETTEKLRTLCRHRAKMIAQKADTSHKMQKFLKWLNFRLDVVVRDVTGLTGIKIIEAICNGDLDPKSLATHRHYNCKKSEEEIAKALVSNERKDYLFGLKQEFKRYRFYQSMIKECDFEIADFLQNFINQKQGVVDDLPTKKPYKKQNKNGLKGALLHEWMIKEMEIVSLRDQPYKASHMTKQETKVGEKQKKQKKNKYKVTNWREYNRSLVKRGDITIWFDEALLGCWYYQGPNQKGAQYKYSGQCMRSLLQLKVVFGLKYRQLEGFASSLLGMMGIELSVPSYCQISRRAKQVEVKMDVPKTKGPMFIVFDSTGLKVYGEGEWKVRKHGYNKRRTWRKLHLGVDEKTGYIHAQVLTKNSKGDGDAQQVPQLLDQVKSPIDRFGADGAYDTYEIWEMLKEKQIEGVIPPQENAMYWVDENDELLDLDRNEIIKKIEKVGRKKWKQQSGYHRRSLSETAMFRFKTIFGPQLYSRRFETQQREAAIKVACLNKMTGLGMPVCQKVA